MPNPKEQESQSIESTTDLEKTAVASNSNEDKKDNDPSEAEKLIVKLQDSTIDFNDPESITDRCRGLLKLASYCEELTDSRLSLFLKHLNEFHDSHKDNMLSFCYSLLILGATTKMISLEQISAMEETILKFVNSLLKDKSPEKEFLPTCLTILPDDLLIDAHKLCEKLFAKEPLDLYAIDVFTICCSALRNLSCCKVVSNFKYSEDTLKFIVGMTGKATQEIVSKNLEQENEEDTEKDDENLISGPAYMADQCLKILEHMLDIDTSSPLSILVHEDCSMLHCLTRLLGWTIAFPFPKENCTSDENAMLKFNLSIMLTILKIFCVLSFNPNQYDSFTNIKGLMEFVMICIIKAHFHCEENRFDVLVQALELMINFYIKNRRTYGQLCLKMYKSADSEEILGIYALLKIMTDSLEKIQKVNFVALSENTSDNQGDGNNREDEDLNNVLAAANTDMELSMIVSFVSILLAFCIDAKKSFERTIKEMLPSEKTVEAVKISQKFLNFSSMTGGMPPTGIILLRHSIKTLGELYPTT